MWLCIVALLVGCVAACAPLHDHATYNHVEPFGGSQCTLKLGVFSIDVLAKERDMLRHTWMSLPDYYGHCACRVDVVFVVATKGISGVNAAALMVEHRRHHDLVLLEDEVENMNGGKTYAWLAYAREHFGDFTWIGKSDMDTFLNVTTLARTLHQVPRTMAYGGALLNDYYTCGMSSHCPQGWVYFSGSFYFLSTDLVSQLMERSYTWGLRRGDEDLVTGRWVVMSHLLVVYVPIFSQPRRRYFVHPVKDAKLMERLMK